MTKKTKRVSGSAPPPAILPVGESRAARLAANLRSIEVKRRQSLAPERVDPQQVAAVGAGILPAGDNTRLRQERDEYLDLARRERAELDNYRKRVIRDMANLKRDSLTEFLRKLFVPIDDLARIKTEAGKSQSYEALYEGVSILEENLWKVLESSGITKIEAKGKPFNPEFHEAMATIPSSDVPPNTVIDVFDPGYMFENFVIRPARVVVSREP
ncbi:MAG: nucleotide exchange factor GrpE [Planctomycetota bacterium]|jgi:molecular chaperone GrpE|nr:nucleotide exchange factor GrpE [Planctomycetota bacterium]